MAGYIGSKASVVSSGAERKKTFTITGATTSLTGLNYTVGKVHVFQNGVRLVDGTDYTATNGTTITLTVAAQSGDNVVVISQASFQVALSGIDDQSNAVAITIDSNENVGIGTSTTSGWQTSPLIVGTGSGNNGLTVYSGSSNSGSIYFGRGTSGSDNRKGQVAYNHSNESMTFHTGVDERMRIDASGNLLAGKTSADFGATAGLEFRGGATDTLFLASDGNKALALNRNTSDGEIIRLSKSDSTVGTIGAKIGHMYIGTDDVGLRFSNTGDYIYPVTAVGGTGRDNAIGLGYNGSRFKDLYLSGGVYLGGTGSANKLDDYEEGTHNLTVNQGAVAINSSYSEAFYTKIGRSVTVSGLMLASGSGDSNDLKLNLPFTAVARTGNQTDFFVGTVMTYNLPTGSGGMKGIVRVNTNRLEFFKTTDNGTWSNLNGNEVNNGDHIYFTITYQTT